MTSKRERTAPNPGCQPAGGVGVDRPQTQAHGDALAREDHRTTPPKQRKLGWGTLGKLNWNEPGAPGLAGFETRASTTDHRGKLVGSIDFSFGTPQSFVPTGPSPDRRTRGSWRVACP